MKKEFTGNILFLIGINLLVKPFYALVIDTSVQNMVGPESYGLFLAIFNFVYIQQIFADLGIQNYNNRNISRNPKDLAAVLPKILSSKILFTLFFIAITLLLSWVFGYLKHFKEILVWIIASQATLSFLLYCRTNISGVGRYFTDSFISVLDKLILIIWMSYVIWVNPESVDFSISYFAQVQLASIAITLFFVLIYTNQKLVKLSLNFDFRFTKELLFQSLPYASLVLLMAGYSRMDGIMLEQLLDDNALEAGIYARSFRLYDTVNNFTFLFAALLLPMFSRMIKAREAVMDLVSWSFRLISLGSLYVIVAVYFRGGDILQVFYTDVEEGFPSVLFLLMLAGFGLSLNYIYGTLLTANGSIGRLNAIALIGFTLNILVNLILIPRWQGSGAAMATLVTQYLVLILQVIYSYKLFDLTLSYLTGGKLIFLCFICILVFYLLTVIWPVKLIVCLLIAGFTSILMAIAIRLVSYKDFIPSFHTFAK